MRTLVHAGCLALVLGLFGGCSQSNDADITSTSGPGWAPEGAPVDGEVPEGGD